MIEQFIETLPQLGIGVVALVVLGGGVYMMAAMMLKSIDTFKVELDAAREERERNQAVFMEFVQSNNHKVTELVLASTRAISEGSEAIRQSSVYISKATEALTIYNDRMRGLSGKY